MFSTRTFQNVACPGWPKRIKETIDPEITVGRALSTYLGKGYSREWTSQRLQAIQVRKELTDEWEDRGVKQGVEYAMLTDEISKAWSGTTCQLLDKRYDCRRMVRS